jgi:hypothetical protein
MPDTDKTQPSLRGSRRRALKRLIEYALAESEELGQLLLARFLGAAALVVDEDLMRPEQDAGGPDRVERALTITRSRSGVGG